jgi:ArsR family transcriptional regulator
MSSIVKTLRVLADPNRLRILLLLRADELSVAELQEILTMGQSTISTHLAQLKQAGLVEDRRTGKSSLYRLSTQAMEEAAALKGHDVLEGQEALKGHDFNRADSHSSKRGTLAPEGRSPSIAGCPRSGFSDRGNNEPIFACSSLRFDRAVNAPIESGPLGPEGRSPSIAPAKGNFLANLLAQAATEIPEAQADQAAMRLVLRKRQDKTRVFFDSVAGRLGKDYVPGKSWKSLAEALLRLMPPMVIADLGAGEGSSALLLAQNAKQVIAVDTSAKMLEVARDQALSAGIQNVEYRLGDMEEIPIDSSTVDLAFFSQSLHHALHPDRAVAEAHRILAPNGRILILDLAKHRFEEARELYADEWLGFTESELESMLAKAGFHNIQTSIVHKEPDPPHFQALLAVADKSIASAP